MNHFKKHIVDYVGSSVILLVIGLIWLLAYRESFTKYFYWGDIKISSNSYTDEMTIQSKFSATNSELNQALEKYFEQRKLTDESK